jgi:hypothetical protein
LSWIRIRIRIKTMRIHSSPDQGRQGRAVRSRADQSGQQVGQGRAAINVLRGAGNKKSHVAIKGQSSLVRTGQVGRKEWAEKGRMLELALACGGQRGLGRTGRRKIGQTGWAGKSRTVYGTGHYGAIQAGQA